MYYKRLDPEAKNEIGAMDAAKFLKNSGLADEFLGKVKTFSNKAVVLIPRFPSDHGYIFFG